MSDGRLSIVIPSLNEGAVIGATLERIRACAPGAEVLVVDGGSTDDTVAIVQRAGARVTKAERGRGVQCHAGAQQTRSEWLLFLHADTLLPLAFERVLGEFAARPTAHIGTFRVRFSDGGWLLNALTWAANRFDSVLTRYGDQGILVRRSFYDEIGGFPPWPLFEDVALLQAARKRTRVHWLPAQVSTSARRFQERGLLRQRLLNAGLMLRYLAGASPHELAARYQARSSRAVDKPGGASVAGPRTPGN